VHGGAETRRYVMNRQDASPKMHKKQGVNEMMNESILAMMGTKIVVLRGHVARKQFRFPRSKKRRVRKKWRDRAINFRERFVPPPITDDEFVVMNGTDPHNSLFSPYDPSRKDASQVTAGPQTICCTPAGEATLRRELGIV